MTQASAPGKAILLGEHAVVYDHPALAVPLSTLRTTVEINPLEAGEQSVRIEAEDLGESFWLHERDERDALSQAIRLTLAEIDPGAYAAIELRIRSAVPIASGLGSGAAASVAIIRALSAHFAADLQPERIAQLAFEVEKIHHGTPSGIDNTVIALETPLYFKRGQPPVELALGKPLELVLADSGRASNTGQVVAAVRRRQQDEGEHIQAIFTQIAELVEDARTALEIGDLATLGTLMDHNHALLRKLGVSSAGLDRLTRAARKAGALGAKLSGAGIGGFVIALARAGASGEIAAALARAGGSHCLAVQVK